MIRLCCDLTKTCGRRSSGSKSVKAMAPKVKSNTLPPPEAMATQPDTSSEDIAQQCEPPAEVPPSKRKRGKAKAKALAETPSSQPAGIKTPKRGKTCDKSKTVKEKRGKCGQPAPGTPRGRPPKESLFISAVATKCAVHQDVVQAVLNAVETVAAETLKTTRRFHVTFLQGRLNEKPEAPAREKTVNGKVVAFAARAAKTTVKFSPAKHFRKLFE